MAGKVEYIIRRALHDESNSGWVWMKKIDSRTIVRITNPENSRYVYCETRKIDPKFIGRYDKQIEKNYCKEPKPIMPKIDKCENYLVISGWYRDALGIKESWDDDENKDDPPRTLQIKKCRCLIWYSLRAAFHHPDLTVRLGTRLGVLGAWLGVIGITRNFNTPIDYAGAWNNLLSYLAGLPEYIIGIIAQIITYPSLLLPAIFALLGYFACRGPKRPNS